MNHHVRKLTVLRSWMDLYDTVKDTPANNDELFGYFHYLQGTLEVINPKIMFKHVKQNILNHETKASIHKGLTIFAYLCIMTTIRNRIQYFLNQWSLPDQQYYALPLSVMTSINEFNNSSYLSISSSSDPLSNYLESVNQLLSQCKYDVLKENFASTVMIQRDINIIMDLCRSICDGSIRQHHNSTSGIVHMTIIKMRKQLLFKLLETMLYIDCLINQISITDIYKYLETCQENRDNRQNKYYISNLSLLAIPRPDFHFLNLLSTDNSPEMSHTGCRYLNTYMNATAPNYL